MKTLRRWYLLIARFHYDFVWALADMEGNYRLRCAASRKIDECDDELRLLEIRA